MGRTMGSPEPTDLENYSTTKLRRANWPEDLDLVRRLLQDYRKWLADHVDPDGSTHSGAPVGLRQIDEEIAGLPGVYGPPRGEIILAFAPDGLAACGALRELEPRVGEIKRVYVRPDHRGSGFGPRLTRSLLDRAGELGYGRVRVDTLPTMAAAIEFYQEMGFTPIRAYRPHPVRGALFFEYKIARPSTRSRRTKN